MKKFNAAFRRGADDFCNAGLKACTSLSAALLPAGSYGAPVRLNYTVIFAELFELFKNKTCYYQSQLNVDTQNEQNFPATD